LKYFNVLLSAHIIDILATSRQQVNLSN